MATPTPSTNTPQKHLMALSSPAPRSVPPMAFDSPAVLNMLNEGGIGMGISMSGMGMSQLGLSQLGRADEDERRRRLEGIVSMLKSRPGRVSEEGIVALCKKEGIDFERAVERDGTTVLTLVIGNEAMCDITIAKGDVTSVKLELASDDDHIFKDSGSRILFRSLTPRPGANKINLMLDQFALNMDKLLRMDKLSAENGGVPCFKAIFAMHKSLRRLFEHEKKMALALVEAKDAPDAAYKAEREVLCKKSGRPRLNAGTCLGLSLEYWMDRRHLIRKKAKSSQSNSTQSEEEAVDDEHPEDAFPSTNKIYSLSIECESSPSSMYTPIRIPESWISDAIEAEKAPDGPDAVINHILKNTPTIDWLDPKPTYLDSSGGAGDHSALNIENASGRLPNIRFVARFNPPLIVPVNVHMQIINSVGLNAPQDYHLTTFVGLAIRPNDPDPGSSSTANSKTIEMQHSRRVLVVDKSTGKESLRHHTNSLYSPQLDYSRALESLPFQHPRQLVELLPTLRQYAFTTSLLQNDFVSPTTTPTTSDTNTANGTTHPSFPVRAKPVTNNLPTPSSTPSPSSPSTSNNKDNDTTLTAPFQLDVAVSYAPPAPRLTVTIPQRHSTTSSSSPNNTNDDDILAYLLSSSSNSTSTPAPPTTPLKMVVDVLPNGELDIQEEGRSPFASNINNIDNVHEDGSTIAASKPQQQQGEEEKEDEKEEGESGQGKAMSLPVLGKNPSSSTAAANDSEAAGAGADANIDLDMNGDAPPPQPQSSSSPTAQKDGKRKADGEASAIPDITVLNNGVGGVDAKRRRVARALDVCGDLGVWAEWLLERS
ncbi:unnamed protein product [Periconia digitata]|uniref:Mediator of RNA polymerase II transcription subunit 1 n=1 Tax=Periconia digitata TaxID=1303443 RepID=A0A9W4XMA0_9PLEO|nr:unnamed protein product [Periconia digitata]